MKFLGGGNSNIFGIFTPKIGEDEPNLTCAYFSDGLVKNHQPDFDFVVYPLFHRCHLGGIQRCLKRGVFFGRRG